jgi:hypothetical protein
VAAADGGDRLCDMHAACMVAKGLYRPGYVDLLRHGFFGKAALFSMAMIAGLVHL